MYFFLQIYLDFSDLSETVISDYQTRGQRFIETAMYQECLRKLNSTRSLVISGNPGEGKTRYAIELMCSKTERGRRLFLTYAQQLENVDLEHIDGVIIDNIYGDVSFDEDKCKRWKELMPFLIARCKNNKPFYVIVTSRSYILMKSADQEIHLMKNIELLTTGLVMEERVSIIQSHCSIDDPLPLISAFKSPIGLPQICYMYSTSDRFCGEDIFRHPEKFIKNILQTFELEDRLLFFALALVIFHGGSLVIPDIKSEEFDKINYYIGLNIGGYDVRMALDRLCGSFIQYNETDGVYQFLHDSLFETCCSYIGSKHSEIFIALSDVRVLVEFARIQNQVETADRIYTYISNNQCNVANLASRYITEHKKNTNLKRLLTKSDALFCEELLLEFLNKLEENDMVASFLNVSDENESLLMELCNMNQPRLIKCVSATIDKYSSEKWVMSQKSEARIRCKRWEFTSCLEIIQDEEDILSDDESYSSSENLCDELDAIRFEFDIINAIQSGDEEGVQNIVKQNILSDSDLCKVTKEYIAKGKEVKGYFETTPKFTKELIQHSVRCRNTSSFLFFIKRAIASRISVQDNQSLFDADLGICDIEKTIDKEDLHLFALYCFVNSYWNPLFWLLEIELSCEDIEYIHDMRQMSERFSKLSDTLSEILAKNSKNMKVKVIHILLLERQILTIEYIHKSIQFGMPMAFSLAMKSAIANRLPIHMPGLDNKAVTSLYINIDKEDLHLLAVYCLVNSCWIPLLYLLEIVVVCNDIEYIHDMKHVNERFGILSDNLSHMLTGISKDLKVIHILRFERPALIAECIRESTRCRTPALFSIAMESAIVNRLSVEEDVNISCFIDYSLLCSSTDAYVKEEIFEKKHAHLLALYFIVNCHWIPLVSLLEIHMPCDDIRYIHDMSPFSKRFKILSDHFSDILARNSEDTQVIHILLLECPDLTEICIAKSVEYGMCIAFSIAMKSIVANQKPVPETFKVSDKDIDRISNRVNKEDLHHLALFCLVNSRWDLLSFFPEIGVPRGDIEYIHQMRHVDESFAELSDIFSNILSRDIKELKVIHILHLKCPFIINKCIRKSVRRSSPALFSIVIKSIIANRLSVQDTPTVDSFEADVEKISKLINKEDDHSLALYCIVNSCWNQLLYFLEIGIPRCDIEYVHDMRHVSKRFGKLSDIFSSIRDGSPKDLKWIDVVRFERPNLIAECLRNSLQQSNPVLFLSAMNIGIANRLSVQDIMSVVSLEANVEKMSKLVDTEDTHSLALYCLVNKYWKPLVSFLEIQISLENMKYIHDMNDFSDSFSLLSRILREIECSNAQSVGVKRILSCLCTQFMSESKMLLDESLIYVSIAIEHIDLFIQGIKGVEDGRIIVSSTEKGWPLKERLVKMINKDTVKHVFLYSLLIKSFFVVDKCFDMEEIAHCTFCRELSNDGRVDPFKRKTILTSNIIEYLRNLSAMPFFPMILERIAESYRCQRRDGLVKTLKSLKDDLSNDEICQLAFHCVPTTNRRHAIKRMIQKYSDQVTSLPEDIVFLSELIS